MKDEKENVTKDGDADEEDEGNYEERMITRMRRRI
jgi:hypothetical protein